MAMAAASPSLSCGFSISHGPIKLGTKNNDQFPAGLRVLVVDDDPICLLILDRLLRECRYEVTTCGKATTALKMLREGRNRFDVVISDVVMPDMDGFKLLELVGLEMDLPVIMMSVNGETSAVMKGITHGACDYLLKPVRIEELRNIWQHVVRKKQRVSDLAPASQEERNRPRIHDGDHNSSANDDLDGSWKFSKKRKDVRYEEEDATEQDNEDPSSSKRPRVVWSVDLHQQFVGAVNQLGIEKAVPKRILELMNVSGLTRENVASHLQKYRLYLKRISNVTHHSGPSFAGTLDMSFSGGIGQSSNDIGLDMTCVDPSLFLHLAAMQDARGGDLMRPSYVQSLLYQGAGSLHQGLATGLNPKQLGQQPQPVITFGEMGKGQTGMLASQEVSVAAGLVGIEQPARFSNTAPGNSTNYALVSRVIQQQPGSELASTNVPSSKFFGQHMLSNNLGGTRDASSSCTPTCSGFDIGRAVGQVRPRYGGKVSVSVVGEVSDCVSPSTRRMDLNVSRLMRSEDQSKLSTRKRDGRQDSKLGQKVEEFCTSISSPQLTKSVSSGQMLNMGSMQEPAQNVISLSSLAIDSCHLKAFMHNNVSQEDLMVVDELKEKDASLGLSRGLKVESSFLQESLYSSDELLNSFWKQQQEGLGLVEDLGMNYSSLDETPGNRRNSAWGSLKKEA